MNINIVKILYMTQFLLHFEFSNTENDHVQIGHVENVHRIFQIFKRFSLLTKKLFRKSVNVSN